MRAQREIGVKLRFTVHDDGADLEIEFPDGETMAGKTTWAGSMQVRASSALRDLSHSHGLARKLADAVYESQPGDDLEER